MWADDTWEETALANLTSSDVFVIVGANESGSFAMTNDEGTSAAPVASEVTIAAGKITSTIADNMKWNISGNSTDGYTFYPNGDSKQWLYCTNSNNGVRVGTNDNKTFEIDSESGYMKHVATSRYVGIYNSQDWRCYTSINANIRNQSFKFYKKTSGGSTKADPELSFAKASYNATYGEEFTPPTLNTAAGFTGPVEYTSSDESVARVSDPETGELRINKGGTTTITATFAGDDAFNAGSASYTLNVTDNRIATTITQEDIMLDIADVGTLTVLRPVVKDASSNDVSYTNSLTAEGMPDVFFDIVADDNGMFGSFDSHGNIILNSVTGTATVKAVYNYFNTSEIYQPSECTFTITVVSPLENIAALTAKTDAGTYKVNLTDAVVTFASGNYAYIQDASGAVAMYKKNHGLNAGDVFNGTAIVAYQLRNQNPQITDLSGVTPVEGTAPNPEEVAQDAWSYTFTDVLSQYFKVTGVTITQSDSKYYIDLNGANVQLYKVGTALGNLNLSKKYTITGFPTLYNTTKELQIFVDPEMEVSVTPTIVADPISLTDFTYVEGNGPSTVKSLTVSGANLTDDIILSLGASSSYEMSLVESSDYTNSLTLTPTAGEVAETIVYVRLKAGLAIESYDGTITLTSTDAENVSVTLAGSVTAPGASYVTWDLSKKSYNEIEDPDIVTWSSTYVTLTNSSKSGGTSASNYLGGDTNNRTSSRFYSNNTLTITPASGYAITSVVFTATSESYATALSNSTWTNAIASASGTTVTITPTDVTKVFSAVIGGTCGFKEVKAYYEAIPATVDATIGGAGYATFSSNYTVDFSATSVEVFTAAVSGSSVVLTPVDSKKVPAYTAVVLKGATATGTVIESTDALTGNELKVSDGTVKGNGKIYVLAKVDDNVRFYKLKNDSPVPAGKAYLQVDGTNVPEFLDFEENTTGIDAVRGQKEEVRGEFYNLAGQRVAQPTKGLYIVNGKKIVIK